MLSPFQSSLRPVPPNPSIAHTVRDSGPSQEHTNLRALTLKVSTQISHDVLGCALRHTYNVFSSPSLLAYLLLELLSRSVADRALRRSRVAFMYITAYGANKLGANKLLHDFFLLKNI